MNTRRPIRTVVVSLSLLLLAVYPTALSALFELLGLDGRAARIAGSRLTVMAALCGAGLLLIGIAAWARSSRLERISTMHVQMLNHLTRDAGGRARLPAVGGAEVEAEMDGLRMAIRLTAEQGGQAYLHALCMPGEVIEIWPKGLEPEGRSERFAVVCQGVHWAAWSTSGRAVLDGGETILEEAFGPAGLTWVGHDTSGIEITMPNGPAEDLLDRLHTAIRVASMLARLNR